MYERKYYLILYARPVLEQRSQGKLDASRKLARLLLRITRQVAIKSGDLIISVVMEMSNFDFIPRCD